MSDLIDREDAIMALRVAYFDKHIQSANDDPCVIDAMTDWAIRQIKAIPSARPKGMTKEIRDINTRALDFVVELIEYIFEYPDDDYMTMECICRKLVKHGFLDKADGYYQTHEIRTNTHECVKDMHDKTSCDTCKHKGEYAYCRLCGRLSENNYEPKDEPQTEDEILREQCRAFMGIVEHTEREGE